MVNPVFDVSPLLFVRIAIKAIMKPVVNQGECSLPPRSFHSSKVLPPACIVLPWTHNNSKCHFGSSLELKIKSSPFTEIQRWPCEYCCLLGVGRIMQHIRILWNRKCPVLFKCGCSFSLNAMLRPFKSNHCIHMCINGQTCVQKF